MGAAVRASSLRDTSGAAVKTTLVTGVGAVISAAATAGQVTLAGLCALILAAIAVTCWIVKDSARTHNAVAIIRAARSGPAPQPLPEEPSADPASSTSAQAYTGDVARSEAGIESAQTV
jgi:hypothetical protein